VTEVGAFDPGSEFSGLPNCSLIFKSIVPLSLSPLPNDTGEVQEEMRSSIKKIIDILKFYFPTVYIEWMLS
jgi:hypothetical protein